jgi:hypothetical protein
LAATNNLIGYQGGTTLACTMTSLATGTTRESATVSNTSNKYSDYLVSLTFRIITGSPTTAGPCVNVYANGSVDGTLWPLIQLSSGAPFTTGAGDASVGALATIPNLKLIGSFGIQTTTSNAERTFRTPAYSVAAGFGGSMPPAFSILIENQIGIAFSATTSTVHTYLEYNGVYTSSGN